MFCNCIMPCFSCLSPDWVWICGLVFIVLVFWLQLGLGFVIAEAKLSSDENMGKLFNECKDYVVTSCQGGAWVGKIDDLCQVYCCTTEWMHWLKPCMHAEFCHFLLLFDFIILSYLMLPSLRTYTLQKKFQCETNGHDFVEQKFVRACLVRKMEWNGMGTWILEGWVWNLNLELSCLVKLGMKSGFRLYCLTNNYEMKLNSFLFLKYHMQLLVIV